MQPILTWTIPVHSSLGHWINKLSNLDFLCVFRFWSKKFPQCTSITIFGSASFCLIAVTRPKGVTAFYMTFHRHNGKWMFQLNWKYLWNVVIILLLHYFRPWIFRNHRCSVHRYHIPTRILNNLFSTYGGAFLIMYEEWLNLPSIPLLHPPT